MIWQQQKEKETVVIVLARVVVEKRGLFCIFYISLMFVLFSFEGFFSFLFTFLTSA